MKHLSVFRRWTSTARQLWLALLGLVLLFVTLVFSTLDFTPQLNCYTIASSQDSLQNTAIASLPAGSSEEDVRQLLDEYFQRSDFAQMWPFRWTAPSTGRAAIPPCTTAHLQGRPALCVCAGAGEPGAAGNRRGAGRSEGGAGGRAGSCRPLRTYGPGKGGSLLPAGIRAHRKPQPAGHRRGAPAYPAAVCGRGRHHGGRLRRGAFQPDPYYSGRGP